MNTLRTLQMDVRTAQINLRVSENKLL